MSIRRRCPAPRRILREQPSPDDPIAEAKT
jgi:hypothetical protein